MELALAIPTPLGGAAGSAAPWRRSGEPTDGELLQRVGTGDRSAFELLLAFFASLPPAFDFCVLSFLILI